jgi:hypothetical protein
VLEAATLFEKEMRMVFVLLIATMLAPMMLTSSATEASAQATCRQKCMDEENACLKRTGNKGQCGDKAKACAARCK